MATAPSPNDLTRQQLDELDALLQRMLSVPQAPADTPMPAAAPARSDTPAADPPPLPPTWRVDPPAPKVETPWPPAPNPIPPAAPKPAAKSVPLPAPKPAPAAPKPATAAPAAAPAPMPVPAPLIPLVVLNALFDGVCGVFGPPGRLLRSTFFKHVYGLAGLGLLAYTAAHVAQVQGWVTLPVQLPWPR